MAADLRRICYHGTDGATAEVIMESGFLPGTYFALHLEDALGFGGEHIFEVAFPYDTEAPDGWQFTIPHHVAADRIVRVSRIEQTVIAVDEDLRRSIYEAHRDAGARKRRRR